MGPASCEDSDEAGFDGAGNTADSQREGTASASFPSCRHCRHNGRPRTPRAQRAATWIARITVAIVFIVNVQCAVGFIIDPSSFTSAYEQTGPAGNAAMQGLGVAFLMWNATYPLVIANPWRHRTLFAVVLAQQIIGLIGETAIMASLPTGHALLTESIQRFIAFDAFGLIIMGISFIVLMAVHHWQAARHKQKR